ncbi:MAG: restriction endonuclease subunit S [Cyclobacteriaceae bacterium]
MEKDTGIPIKRQATSPKESHDRKSKPLLLEYFPALTQYPFNAEKVMDLVLQMAVQGRLTKKWREVNPDVEPASVLLEKIKEQKVRLIAEKKIRKENPLIEIVQGIIPFDIPRNWEWVRLGTIGNIFNGNSISAAIKADKYEGLNEGYPFVATKDVGYGFENIDEENGIRIPFDQSKFKVARKGTVLICSEGGSSGKKMGICTQDICFGNKLYAIEQYGAVEPTFIMGFYYTSIFYKLFSERMTGLIGGISISKFKDIPFPLPPLEEQKEIVRIVGQLKEEIDALNRLAKERLEKKHQFVVSSLHHLTESEDSQHWYLLKDHFSNTLDELENIKKLRETILQLAVRGKLTKKWRESNPDTEPASILLQQIQEEKERLIEKKKIKKEKPLTPISEGEIPYEVPEGWEWVRMVSVVKNMSYGTSEKTNDNPNNVPVFRMGNITTEGELLFDNFKYLSPSSESLPKLYVSHYDLIFNRTNSYDLVGKSAVFEGDDNSYTLASYLIKVSLFLDYVNPFYCNNYIISKVCRVTQIEPEITAQTNQANFSGSKLKNILFPLPPFAEQKAIVQQVDYLLSLCDTLESHIKTRNETAEQLMEVVVGEVLEGAV